ncbi:MAG TPA: hypothetical protein VF278_10130 [Pirellulales bacterium]
MRAFLTLLQIDRLFRGRFVFAQIGAAEHGHPALENVFDLRGKTDHRQLIRLMYHAAGVLTGVSYPMHLASGFRVAAGRLKSDNRAWFQHP